ncbi:LARGE RIBOSOMAL RNA SUBUNIT ACCUMULATION PROTEIN YCED-like protein 1 CHLOROPLASTIC [Salix viminalis]|uniref:LARGE RIBOSOMAL RNA SUBUNIT ACCUMULATION PROTEIN YCED-like protein 1 CHLOROPLASTIC n=1 Tax=Salix viminalis TaxID=40686 RepID=A0A9Q0TZQ5_SALVM|nr:LARGE RIBOSOMAL RNA SUBUNIT ACCUMULATION PROTEIN YCED-like protein 1 CHLOROPLASTIC [Salix viminalis]
MSLVYFTTPIALSPNINQFKADDWFSQKRSLSNPRFSVVDCKILRGTGKSACDVLRNKSPSIIRFTARHAVDSNSQKITDVSLNWDDQEEEDAEDMESPWEGAIIYKRNSSISHVEYCTTLERFGLGKLSTEISKSRASIMGLRVTKAVKDYPLGTPVQISIDVTKKKKRLRLDGIIKTVITLACYRCGEPVAEGIFSNFSLLLCEEPIEEPEIIDMGTVFGNDKLKSSICEEEDDDEASIDWDDRLHFPPEDKEIDISKSLRDMVHVEITLDVICDPACKGMCLECGTNLNKSSCNCSTEKEKDRGPGPLKDLKKQMLSKS